MNESAWLRYLTKDGRQAQAMVEGVKRVNELAGS